jgi:hypothetical protein
VERACEPSVSLRLPAVSSRIKEYESLFGARHDQNDASKRLLGLGKRSYHPDKCTLVQSKSAHMCYDLDTLKVKQSQVRCPEPLKPVRSGLPSGVGDAEGILSLQTIEERRCHGRARIPCGIVTRIKARFETSQ